MNSTEPLSSGFAGSPGPPHQTPTSRPSTGAPGSFGGGAGDTAVA